MSMEFFLSLALDLTLIGLLVMGILHALKLSKQLQELKASRADMQRFVMDFNATVMRAENGIKGLKMAARESGDDLEHLIEKGSVLRDELHFLVESADQVASRLSTLAATAARATVPDTAPAKKPAPAPAAAPAPKTAEAHPPHHAAHEKHPHKHTTTAEKDLLRALEKTKGGQG